MTNFSYKVKPGQINGKVVVSGAKNSVLRVLAATILSEQPIHLKNYPGSLLDVLVHEDMLSVLGKKIEKSGDEVVISEEAINNELNWDGRSIRNTLLILGALLARTGYGKVPAPGGCKLGERKYDIHVMIFELLGAKVWEEDGYLCASTDGLKGTDIELPIRSTGATENAILCATQASGKTTIWNPHIRPEILDLVNFLNKSGAEITVYGQERIEVHGTGLITGITHEIMPDNMEALTWLVAAAITDGDLEIENFPFEDLEVPLVYLRESGVRIYRCGNDAHIGKGAVYPIEISTGPYPGINSDMQPLFAVFGACSKGVSKIVDLRFPGRYGYAEELKKMNVSSEVVGDMLVVKGGNKMNGSEVTALDLRAGIALLLSALVADGETTIKSAWQIERGYHNLIEKLATCGVHVERIES